MKRKLLFCLTAAFFLTTLLLPCFPNSSYTAHCRMCPMTMDSDMDCQTTSFDRTTGCSCCFFYSNGFTQSLNNDIFQDKVKSNSKFSPKFDIHAVIDQMRAQSIHLLSLQSPPRSAQSSMPLFLQMSVLRL